LYGGEGSGRRIWHYSMALPCHPHSATPFGASQSSPQVQPTPCWWSPRPAQAECCALAPTVQRRSLCPKNPSGVAMTLSACQPHLVPKQPRICGSTSLLYGFHRGGRRKVGTGDVSSNTGILEVRLNACLAGERLWHNGERPANFRSVANEKRVMGSDI